MKSINQLLMAALICIASFASFATPANAFDAKDKAAIESIIREYLLANPEILGEMQIAYEQKQKEEQIALQRKTLTERADVIFSSPNQVEIGNKDAKYKVVEFYDYNCPFCQRAMGDMDKILEANPDVKFIIKEWPVLGENSYKAHVVSIAFTKLHPEKYQEFHKTLLGMKGRKGEKEALALAVELGADEAAMREEMNKPYVLETLRENNSIATDLGITGTPSYVIGDQVVFGAVGVEQLTRAIKKLRQ